MLRPRRRRSGPLVYALYANAVLLLAILVVLVTRSGIGGPSSAYAAPQLPPIAGGGGVFVVPAQFTVTNWGCYLFDIDKQTLCAYEYVYGQHQLKLTAARNFRYDRDLARYNTSPNPEEVRHMIEMEKNTVRGRDAQPGNPDDVGVKPDGDTGPSGPAPAGNSGPGSR